MRTLYWSTVYAMILVMGFVLISEVAGSGLSTQGWIMSHMPVASEEPCQ